MPPLSSLLMLASILVSSTTLAVELIQQPKKVLLRAVHDLEAVDAVIIESKNYSFSPDRKNGVTEAYFDQVDFCAGLSYTVQESVNEQRNSLSHLCRANKPSSNLVLIGDTQEHHDKHKLVAKFLKRSLSQWRVDSVILAGDIVQTGVLAEWKQYRDIAQSHYSNRFPIIPVIGNHEYKKDKGLEWWQKIYGSDATKLGYYVVEYKHAVVFVLNSNVYQYSEAERNRQTNWLAEALAKEWDGRAKMVTFHHAPYSSGVASIILPKEPKYVRKNWIPLFEENDVKLVLVGHEHLYERLSNNGVCYLVSGPAGGDIGRVKPKVFRSKYSRKLIAGVRTASLVRASELGIEVASFDAISGNEIDSFSTSSCSK